MGGRCSVAPLPVLPVVGTGCGGGVGCPLLSSHDLRMEVRRCWRGARLGVTMTGTKGALAVGQGLKKEVALSSGRALRKAACGEEAGEGWLTNMLWNMFCV